MEKETRMSDEPTGRDEIAALARHAGLALPPTYLDELVSACGHVRAMIARLPDGRPRGDEPAHVFDAPRFAPKEG
jgi:hypothetical protein